MTINRNIKRKKSWRFCQRLFVNFNKNLKHCVGWIHNHMMNAFCVRGFWLNLVLVCTFFCLTKPFKNERRFGMQKTEMKTFLRRIIFPVDYCLLHLYCAWEMKKTLAKYFICRLGYSLISNYWTFFQLMKWLVIVSMSWTHGDDCDVVRIAREKMSYIQL